MGMDSSRVLWASIAMNPWGSARSTPTVARVMSFAWLTIRGGGASNCTATHARLSGPAVGDVGWHWRSQIRQKLLPIWMSRWRKPQARHDLEEGSIIWRPRIFGPRCIYLRGRSWRPSAASSACCFERSTWLSIRIVGLIIRIDHGPTVPPRTRTGISTGTTLDVASPWPSRTLLQGDGPVPRNQQAPRPLRLFVCFVLLPSRALLRPSSLARIIVIRTLSPDTPTTGARMPRRRNLRGRRVGIGNSRTIAW